MLQGQAQSMRVASSLSPDTDPGPCCLRFTQQPEGSGKSQADLDYLLVKPHSVSHPTEDKPKSSSALYTGTHTPFPHPPDPSIPLLQTYRSPSASLPAPEPFTPTPAQGVCTCCSFSCLRDHVLDICRVLSSKNPQKVGNECPLEMSGHQPWCEQRARSDELCGQ